MKWWWGVWSVDSWLLHHHDAHVLLSVSRHSSSQTKAPSICSIATSPWRSCSTISQTSSQTKGPLSIDLFYWRNSCFLSSSNTNLNYTPAGCRKSECWKRKSSARHFLFLFKKSCLAKVRFGRSVEDSWFKNMSSSARIATCSLSWRILNVICNVINKCNR